PSEVGRAPPIAMTDASPNTNWDRWSPIRTRSEKPNTLQSHGTAVKRSAYTSSGKMLPGGNERFWNMTTPIHRKENFTAGTKGNQTYWRLQHGAKGSDPSSPWIAGRGV